MESIKKLKIYLIKNRSIFINNQKHKHIAKIDLTASNVLTSKKKKKKKWKQNSETFIHPDFDVLAYRKRNFKFKCFIYLFCRFPFIHLIFYFSTFNPLMHNAQNWSDTLWKFCSICCKIFKVFWPFWDIMHLRVKNFICRFKIYDQKQHDSDFPLKHKKSYSFIS